MDLIDCITAPEEDAEFTVDEQHGEHQTRRARLHTLQTRCKARRAILTCQQFVSRG